jgi:hypothetical protein
MRRTASAVAALIAAGPIATAQFDVEAWRRNTEATLRTHVALVTGDVAAPCGIAWVPPAASAADYFPSREKEVATALACVEGAARERRATWAFWQYRGIDSTVMGGLAVTAEGAFRLLHYDSYPPGRFDATPCPSPRLDPAAPYGIACASAPAADRDRQLR